ncbi:MAG TPA: 2'-5' RNA ligase family protein [Bellilinea sp.]|nr:2'-5' RNA ligase family protein [Bellilinea sp.]
MYALLSELDEIAKGQIESVLKSISTECGLSVEPMKFEKHLSWLGMQDINTERARTVVERIARGQKPLHLHADYLGIFPGIPVILFIGVAKNKALYQVHDSFWKGLSAWTVGTNKHYSPELWIPHITFCMADPTTDSVPLKYLEKLLHIPLDLDFTLASVTLTKYEDAVIENVFEFEFK